jgi:glycosyltransferase involved in cell wall biosynthesis
MENSAKRRNVRRPQKAATSISMQTIGKTSALTDARAAHPAPEQPAVSVIVPCYNGGRFLDGLMASLAGQTFRDFEIIIVNDGSDDEETLRKLAALDGRARVIHQDNRGPSAARNVGIGAARADILFILDCDDTIEPTFLAETVPLLRAAPPEFGMVVTHLRLVGAETGTVRRYFNRFDLLFTNTLSVGLVLRKRCCLAVGGYDESMREGYEDWDFSLRLVGAGFRGIEVPKPLYVYVIADETQASRSSGVDKKLLYGKLWRQIRERHAASYRPLAMLKLWWETRDGTGRVPLWKGMAACALALLLPDAWFNRLIAHLHRGHRADKPSPPVAGPPAGSGWSRNAILSG